MENILNIEQLRGIASRKNKAQEYKSVRNEAVSTELQNGWVVQKQNKTTTRLTRRKNHQVAFEDRVWMLMYRMGFIYMSGQGGASLIVNINESKQPDNHITLVAIDEEVALAIDCKSSPALHKATDLSNELPRFRILRDHFTKAVKDRFSSSAKRSNLFVILTNQIVFSEADRTQASDAGITILTDTDLTYYETLVSQIGTAARYQFLADLLAGRAIPGLELTVPAIKTKMGKFIAYNFSVRPEYLLKISFVSHRAKGKPSDIDAYQRMLKKSRLNRIRQYISEGGIFPTNIVVNIAQSRWLTFDRGKQESEDPNSTFGWLNIRPAYRVAWIIDGQHRLFAYAGHAEANKSLISVMAFVDLPASEQARLFVDINAEQRKVKQSLLQELYAELHWDADDIEVRVQAILSKAIQALDGDPTSPFFHRIQKADDARTDLRCISLTTIFKALESSRLFVSKRKGRIVEYGPFWRHDNITTMKRTQAVLNGFFEVIGSTARELWNKGAGPGGGLAMNNGVTACINALKSIFHHLQTVQRIDFTNLDDMEVVELVKPYGLSVGSYFSDMSSDQISWFRRLQGAAGQITGTRRIEEAIRGYEQTFDPPGLKEFLDREKTQTTTRAFETIRRIEQILQSTVLTELKNEFGTAEADWFFGGVPKSVRKKVDDRINEEAGKKGGRGENFDLIDYREIIIANWDLLGDLLGRGTGGNKDAKTKWLVEVNELRKPVMHASKGVSLPITEEQLTSLQEIEEWLRAQIGASTS